MPSIPFDPSATRAGRRVSAISIAWTLVVGGVAVLYGFASGSAALVAFGLVSFVDLTGSVALVHHFRHALRTDTFSDRFERRAHRIVTVGLFAVGAVTLVISATRLAIGHFPHPTGVEIVVSSVSLVVLAGLAVWKGRVARTIPSAALRSDGFLSAIGATQAAVVLASAVVASVWSWRWADDAAAVVIGAAAIVIAIRTGPGVD